MTASEHSALAARQLDLALPFQQNEEQRACLDLFVWPECLTHELLDFDAWLCWDRARRRYLELENRR